ncbi:deoxyhypusine synthase-like [Bactrocera neohumeralis]|uniref:deoxyhypusine synthase-like n=1 Tax=Bactrocera neohumeralis TaxID=98809 RepID=UPI002165D871|nr:deoxyhypusine synthase-like [Bactrocera neohumeralis]
MATIAQSAVLVPSAAEIDLDFADHHASDATDEKPRHTHKPQLSVSGPKGNFGDLEHLLRCYPSLGFQASHYGQAVELARKMIVKQPPSSIYLIRDGEFVKVEPEEPAEGGDRGTGCREAVRFLVQEGVVPRAAVDPQTRQSSAELSFAALKRDFGGYAAKILFPNEAPTEGRVDSHPPRGPYKSFLSALVLAGGGPEHDIRRACQSYRVDHYASEPPRPQNTSKKSAGAGKKTQQRSPKTKTDRSNAPLSRFGNVLYASSASPQASFFDTVMQTFVQLLCQRQADQKAAYQAAPEQTRTNARLDGTAYCSWSTTPSEVWALAGLWLEDLFTFALATAAHTAKTRGKATSTPLCEKQESNGAVHVDPQDGVAAATSKTDAFRPEARRLAESTVLYWAARQEVPVYCPSFADGDIAKYLYQHYASTKASPQGGTMLKVDLVRDIHGINRLAMYSKRSGMLICGGGSVKHHVCNANLMRNGADYTVFISNGQEFDGSDAARQARGGGVVG